MPTSLVTGAAGFVGQHLVRDLLRDGHEVVGGVLGSVPAGLRILSREEVRQVRWIDLDVTSEVSIRRALRTLPEFVYHLAAQASVGRSFSQAVETWAVNATGTLLLLQGVVETGATPRVLVVSSSEVYGAVPMECQPIRETEPLAPTSPYAASKAAAEIVARQVVASTELPIVIARSFSHIGPGQALAFAVPNWADQLARIARGTQEPVLRVGNLEARRDLLDVRDVVRAYRLLICAGAAGEGYNVCSGMAHRLHDVVEQMVDLSGANALVEVDPDRIRPVDIPLLVGDPGRLRALGWSPGFSLSQTLTDLLAAARHETT